MFFFFNDTATTEIYTLSLHDALPISSKPPGAPNCGPPTPSRSAPTWSRAWSSTGRPDCPAGTRPSPCRSEEHTSELQSQSNLVCRLLLEKKKQYCHPPPHTTTRATRR